MIYRSRRLGFHSGSQKSEARVDGSTGCRLNLSKRCSASQGNAENRYGQSFQCEFHTVLLNRIYRLNLETHLHYMASIAVLEPLNSGGSTIREVLRRNRTLLQTKSCLFCLRRG